MRAKEETVRNSRTVQDDPVWATQKNMAELFDTSRENVTIHLQNIFIEGELEKLSTSKKFLLVQKEGGREVSRKIEHYNLDAIISFGCRVNYQ